MIQRILKFFFPTFVSDPVQAAKPKHAPTFTTVERLMGEETPKARQRVVAKKAAPPKKRGRPKGSKNKPKK